jgi:uncharacterized membrane protein
LPITVKVLLLLSIVWALAALAVEVMLARGGGRRDYSQRTGSPMKGVAYAFTVAMLPANKESVSRHPAKFAIGVAMHIGVILALLCVVLLVIWPQLGREAMSLFRPVVAIALVASLYLLVRRIASRDLKALSAPDDYLAIAATCGLLAFACFVSTDVAGQTALLIYAMLLFVYLPLGKLRHAVFFFVARADYGRRLGYRGIYPPARRERGVA